MSTLGPSIIRIKNFQIQQQINRRKDKRSYWNSPCKTVMNKTLKYQIKYKCKRFGYDYQYGQSQILKQMKEQFLNKSLQYIGLSRRPKVLKNKDKYQRNLQLGKVFKINPLVKIFNKIEMKIIKIQQIVAFMVLKTIF